MAYCRKFYFAKNVLLGVIQAYNECFTSKIMLPARWGKSHPKEERAENTKEERALIKFQCLHVFV